MRRISVYMPPEIARRLAMYCAEFGLEMSTTVTEAVDEMLKLRGK